VTPLRIALANWTARVAGGAESYLRDLVPALRTRGHDLALWVERDVPENRPAIATGVPVWRADRSPDGALAELRAWKPDLVFVHGIEHDPFEAALLDVAPAVCFVHTYRGTCISGEKAFKLPTRRPCDRTFGPACLALFYPRRCGGLNPATMARDYAKQRARGARMRRYARLVTASGHMRDECLRHGVPPGRVVVLPVPPPDAPLAPGTSARPESGPPHRLVWVGRMEPIKGGDLCLAAASEAARRLDRPLTLTLLGDGRARTQWEARARALGAEGAALSAEFRGWSGEDEVDRVFADADLLVLSSVWPEPFGRVGLEAGRHGVPVAAFSVGGIPEWLTDGVNGRLAPGNPPTVEGLTDAMVGCLRDPAEHQRLCAGARAAARRWTFQDHAASLERLFRDVIAHG
jgi:glycosyltransferase involved in cell wall biosynthesis